MRPLPLLLAVLVAVPMAAETWRSIGPDGGAFDNVIVDRRVPDRLFAATVMRVWMSDDDGASWRSIPELSPPLYGAAPGAAAGVLNAVASDPRNRDVVFVATQRGLFRSDDGGHSFAFAGVGPAYSADFDDSGRIFAGTYHASAVSSDGGRSWTFGKFFDGYVALHVSAGVAYAETEGDLYRSTDGTNWTWIHGRDNGWFAIDGDRAFVIRSGTVLRSDDRGDTWTTLPGPAPGQGIGVPTVDLVAHRIYVGTATTLRVTDDAGASWRFVEGLPAGDVEALSAAGSRLLTASGHHLLSSGDGGATWHRSDAGIAGGAVANLAFDARRPDRLLAVVDGDLARREGGGWTTAFHDLLYYASDVVADPANPEHELALVEYFGDDHLLQTRDGGATWAWLADVPDAWHAYRLVVDPARGTIYIVDGSETIFASDDAGATWRKLRPGVDHVFSIALTPEAIYAATSHGVMRSLDRGTTWTALAAIPVSDECRSEDPAESYAQFVQDLAVADGAIVVAGWNCRQPRISTSVDGGKEWRGPAVLPVFREHRPYDVSTVTRIVADPKHDGRLFAATDLGVYRTDDGGETWRPINDGLDDATGGVQALALDTVHDRLYAGTGAAGVWQLDLEEPAPRRRPSR